MKRVLSLVSAIAVTLTSFVSVASAAKLYSYADDPDNFPLPLNSYGVPTEDFVKVSLDSKIKWANSSDAGYAQSINYSTSAGTNEVTARTYLDMSNVAAEWNVILDKVIQRRPDSLTKDFILEHSAVTGEFTVKIAAPSGISNAVMAGASPKDAYAWSDKVKEFFTEKVDPVYDAASNTFTITMKVKDDVDNKKLDEYFANPEKLELYVYSTVADTSPNTFSYTIDGEFEGYVDITVFSNTEPVSTIYFGDGTYKEILDGGNTIRENNPATDNVKIIRTSTSRGGGGGGSRATQAPTATSQPFEAATSVPMIETIDGDYNSEEKILELGDIIGYTVTVTTSTGASGTYNIDYTVSDKDGNVLTPSELNAILADPNTDLNNYVFNLGEGVTAETQARYKSSGSGTGAEIDYNNHFAYIIGYPDGSVQPEGDITRAEVATIFFRLLTDESRVKYWATENSFSDVTSEYWYNNAISTVENAGIVNGYEDGTFRPDAPITRAEFAMIASRFAKVGGVIKADFTDISGHWAETAIMKAASVGWVTGYEDGSYRPDNKITRAEAMTIINRVTYRIIESDGVSEDAIKWPDNPESAWYYAQVEEATNGHKYSRKHLGDTEAWTELIEQRDWSTLERETSQKAEAAIVGIDNGAIVYDGEEGTIISEEKED